VDLPQETQRRVLQSIGLIASILVLVFSVRIGTLLWPSSQARWRLRGFTLLLATLPGLVLAAARVNNDVLVHLFSVIALLTACTVLLHGKRMGYIVLGFWTALALLSKATALLLLPLFMLSILTVSSALRWPKRVKGAALFLCVVIALTWWLPVLRGAGPEGHAIVGNAGNLNSGLMLESTVTSFTVFSPVAIITHPFNNPWSDEDRRQYFWEYLYRGAFFGEFRFPDAVRGTAQVALAMGLPILLLGIIGFLKRRGEGRPLLQYMRIALVILLLGHVAFRLGFPYSSSQDFRYSVLVAIPIAAFCMHGIPTRKGVWRTAGMALVALFCMANAVFMAGVIGGFA
jgi:4-amino-4-deoxy-L-arabinose transferase-like glycosyltransferase